MGVWATGDLDAGSKEHIVVEGDQAEVTAWADVDMVMELGSGFGEQGTETDGCGRGTVLQGVAIKSVAEVIAGDPWKECQELGMGFEGTVGGQDQ